MITNQRELKRRFFDDNPGLDRRKMKDHAGTGKMYCCDTRCAFAEWIDALARNGEILQDLADRATI